VLPAADVIEVPVPFWVSESLCTRGGRLDFLPTVSPDPTRSGRHQKARTGWSACTIPTLARSAIWRSGKRVQVGYKGDVAVMTIGIMYHL
jgi:hypothetical protein